jgi:DNA-binding NtrC family response regulator
VPLPTFPSCQTLKMAKVELEKMLEKHSGHRAHVAQVLGISERNLYRLLHKHGIKS